MCDDSLFLLEFVASERCSSGAFVNFPDFRTSYTLHDSAYTGANP